MFRHALILLSVLVGVSHVIASDWPRIQSARWQTAEIRPEKLHFAKGIAAEIRWYRSRYREVERTTSVPWDVIAVIHNMECSLNFNQNLANGDSIRYKTRHVPKNRPPGDPPYTWEYCAIDALQFDHMAEKNWRGMGNTLNNIELYNGAGYQKYHPDVPTPYLYSWTSLEKPGKYIADGKWSATARSGQCGCVPILKLLNP